MTLYYLFEWGTEALIEFFGKCFFVWLYAG